MSPLSNSMSNSSSYPPSHQSVQVVLLLVVLHLRTDRLADCRKFVLKKVVGVGETSLKVRLKYGRGGKLKIKFRWAIAY